MGPNNGRSIAIDYSLQLLENNHAQLLEDLFRFSQLKYRIFGE